MKNFLLASVFALAFSAAPAHAVLQISVSAGASTFFCADNTACDQNPAVGTLQIGDQTIGGVLVNGSIQQSVKGLVDSLNTSSLSIINTTGSTVAAASAIGDTDFVGPISKASFAGAGTWQDAVGSTALLQWFLDPANAQGAANAFDTPGTLIGNFFNAPTLAADSFSTEGATAVAANGPFSMTEFTSGSLSPGAELINRGQTELGAVPEPSTWAMLILGFGMLALVARRSKLAI